MRPLQAVDQLRSVILPFPRCWHAASLLQTWLFGRDIGSLTGVEDMVRSKTWVLKPAPQHGCLVELSLRNLPKHVGTYLDVDGGVIVHTHDSGDILVESPSDLEAQKWKARYWHHNG